MSRRYSGCNGLPHRGQHTAKREICSPQSGQCVSFGLSASLGESWPSPRFAYRCSQYMPRGRPRKKKGFSTPAKTARNTSPSALRAALPEKPTIAKIKAIAPAGRNHGGAGRFARWIEFRGSVTLSALLSNNSSNNPPRSPLCARLFCTRRSSGYDATRATINTMMRTGTISSILIGLGSVAAAAPRSGLGGVERRRYSKA